MEEILRSTKFHDLKKSLLNNTQSSYVLRSASKNSTNRSVYAKFSNRPPPATSSNSHGGPSVKTSNNIFEKPNESVTQKRSRTTDKPTFSRNTEKSAFNRNTEKPTFSRNTEESNSRRNPITQNTIQDGSSVVAENIQGVRPSRRDLTIGSSIYPPQYENNKVNGFSRIESTFGSNLYTSASQNLHLGTSVRRNLNQTAEYKSGSRYHKMADFSRIQTGDGQSVVGDSGHGGSSTSLIYPTSHQQPSRYNGYSRIEDPVKLHSNGLFRRGMDTTSTTFRMGDLRRAKEDLYVSQMGLNGRHVGGAGRAVPGTAPERDLDGFLKPGVPTPVLPPPQNGLDKLVTSMLRATEIELLDLYHNSDDDIECLYFIRSFEDRLQSAIDKRIKSKTEEVTALPFNEPQPLDGDGLPDGNLRVTNWLKNNPTPARAEMPVILEEEEETEEAGPPALQNFLLKDWGLLMGPGPLHLMVTGNLLSARNLSLIEKSHTSSKVLSAPCNSVVKTGCCVYYLIGKFVDPTNSIPRSLKKKYIVNDTFPKDWEGFLKRWKALTNVRASDEAGRVNNENLPPASDCESSRVVKIKALPEKSSKGRKRKSSVLEEDSPIMIAERDTGPKRPKKCIKFRKATPHARGNTTKKRKGRLSPRMSSTPIGTRSTLRAQNISTSILETPKSSRKSYNDTTNNPSTYKKNKKKRPGTPFNKDVSRGSGDSLNDSDLF